eukprot:scaffold1499_cov170-Amphora_coffeaeformis.AAC.11
MGRLYEALLSKTIVPNAGFAVSFFAVYVMQTQMGSEGSVSSRRERPRSNMSGFADSTIISSVHARLRRRRANQSGISTVSTYE